MYSDKNYITLTNCLAQYQFSSVLGRKKLLETSTKTIYESFYLGLNLGSKMNMKRNNYYLKAICLESRTRS